MRPIIAAQDFIRLSKVRVTLCYHILQKFYSFVSVLQAFAVHIPLTFCHCKRVLRLEQPHFGIVQSAVNFEAVLRGCLFHAVHHKGCVVGVKPCL